MDPPRGRGRGRGRVPPIPVYHEEEAPQEGDHVPLVEVVAVVTPLPDLIRQVKRLGAVEFAGGLNHQVADWWIDDMDKCFSVIECSEV